MNIRLLLSLFMIILSATPMATAYAEMIPNLSNYFQDTIERVDHALADPSAAQCSASPAMELQAINIDINSTISFGISGVLNLTIAPEINFILTPVAP